MSKFGGNPEQAAMRQPCTRESIIGTLGKTNMPTVKRNPLAQPLARWTQGVHAFDTALKGLCLHRWEAPTEPTSYMLAPSICLIGQGRKRLFLGASDYVYDAQGFLITSVNFPVVSQIIQASPEAPYLGLTMELDMAKMAEIILAHDLCASTPSAHRGIAVGTLSPALLDAFARLLDLLDHPQDASALAPLIQQEIYYRLLSSEQGPRLCQIIAMGQQGYQVGRAIDWLKENFRQSVRIEELASRAGLSVSAFHSHFRSLTTMSPLQFQKRIRLTEARRVMLAERLDASSAAFAVGYESPSQFNREYSRLFGAPPKRDINRLREAAQITAGQVS